MKPRESFRLEAVAGSTIRTAGEPLEIEVVGSGATGHLWNVITDRDRVEVAEHHIHPDESAFGAPGRESLRPPSARSR